VSYAPTLVKNACHAITLVVCTLSGACRPPILPFWRSLNNFASATRVRTFASRNYRLPVLRRWRSAAAAMVGRNGLLPWTLIITW